VERHGGQGRTSGVGSSSAVRLTRRSSPQGEDGVVKGFLGPLVGERRVPRGALCKVGAVWGGRLRCTPPAPKGTGGRDEGAAEVGRWEVKALREGASLRPHWLPAGPSPGGGGEAAAVLGALVECAASPASSPKGWRCLTYAAPPSLPALNAQIVQDEGATEA